MLACAALASRRRRRCGVAASRASRAVAARQTHGPHVGARSHIVQQLLELGYTVHGTVRSSRNVAKNGHLLALPGAAERLRLFDVDLMKPEQFDEAVRGERAPPPPPPSCASRATATPPAPHNPPQSRRAYRAARAAARGDRAHARPFADHRSVRAGARARAGCTYVLHTASPFAMVVKDPQADLVVRSSRPSRPRRSSRGTARPPATDGNADPRVRARARPRAGPRREGRRRAR